MAISLIDVNPEVQSLFHQISFNQQVVDLVNAVIGNNYITLKETTAPSHTAGYGKIYVKSSDSKLYFKDDSGTEYDLTGVGVGGANTTLSNLTTTSINESLIPQSGKTLGDSSNRWAGLYSTFGNFSTNVDITANLTVDTNVLVVDSVNNRVGILNPSPAYTLDIGGDVNIANGYFSVRRTSGNPQITILSYSATSTDGSNLMLQRAKGGSFSSFTAVQSGDVLGAIQTLGATGANTWGNVNSQIQIVATENYTGSAYGCNMNFQVTTTGTTSRNTRFIIANDGSITAGSSSGTGTGSLFAGATTVTTLTGSSTVNIDSGTFYVDSVNNRVGINTASPSYSLHCVGTSYFTSTVTILSGQIITNSTDTNSFLNLDDSGNCVLASRSSIVLKFDYDNSQTNALLNFTANNSDILWSMTELGAVTHTLLITTGSGYTFSADSVTTGTMTRIISNSSDTSTRALLQIYNINTSATGAYPLLLTQNAVTSTNFKKYIVLDNITIWKSNGTDPNGALSGTAGDICLNSNGNVVKYCTGTTNWTAM